MARLKRWQLIESAYRKVRMLKPGRQLNSEQIEFGTRDLNLLLQQESQTEAKRKHLYALETWCLVLVADQHIYTPKKDDFLPDNIEHLEGAFYRGADGTDDQIKIYTPDQYQNSVTNKDEKGDPTSVFLERHTDTAKQKLFIHPALDTITAASVVRATDGKSYICIMKHTSAVVDEPTVGPNWEMFWKEGGHGTTAWVTATAYVGGEVIGLTFRRPLWEFTNPNSNPDFPIGWDLYLIYKLAVHMGIDSGLSAPDLQSLKLMHVEASLDLFPSTRSESDEVHNKSVYF